MTFTLPKASDQVGYEQCPVGLYVFRVKEMQDGIEGSAEYGGGERVKWVFTVERVIDANDPEPTADNPDPKSVEDWVGEEVWGFTSLSMNKKATMRSWAEALLGREIPEGEALMASDLIGKRAKATVGRGQTGRQKITSLVPYKPKQRQAPADVEPEDEGPLF